MYKKINQIKNSKIGFSANEEYLFAPKKEKGFIVYNLLDNKISEYFTQYDVFEIIILSKSEFVVTKNYARIGDIYAIRDKTIILQKELVIYSVKNIKNNFLEIGVTKEIEGFKSEWYPFTALYDWQKDKILWQASYDMFFFGDYIIGRRFNAPHRLNPLTGEVLWSYSFADFGKVIDVFGIEEAVSIHNSNKAFTGVIGNQLWISLNTMQHLVLDIHTGKQLALLGEPYDYKKDYYAQKVMSGGQIDEKLKKIISLGNSQYREINTDTFEAIFIDLREEFDKYGVSSVGDIRFDDDYIYFYDKIFFGNQPRNKVAVLDRKTLKVVWTHDFAQYGTFPMQMEKIDTHLFVLDSSGTLHIFERES
jgi:outer membrane protein assembly factor BamB